MIAAYADPPYIGQARKHYSHDPKCAEVDHEELIGRLMTYEAWALSASSPSLHVILPMCPKETRIASWVKPFGVFKPGVNPAYVWEPVLFWGARAKRSRTEPTVRDWHSESITLKKGLVGAKPYGFCRWIFELLGLTPADTLVDLYPGTGAVTKAWEIYCTPPVEKETP